MLQYIISTLNSFIIAGHLEVVAEFVMTLRLAGYDEQDNVLMAILHIMHCIDNISFEAETSDAITDRTGKHTNFKSHVQWCAVNALIPAVKNVALCKQTA